MKSKKFEDYLYNCMKNAFNEVFLEKIDLTRMMDLHPSQLPFCAYKFLIGYINYKDLQPHYLSSDITLNIGTVIHNLLEKYMTCNKGLFGEWYCPKCFKKIGLSLYPKEKCCRFYKYREISINYKGIVGHIDTVIKDENSDYWIVDYKTTTKSKLSEKAKDPGLTYKLQIFTYALCMQLQYGIKIKGVCLMFIAKENPCLENISMYTSLVTKRKLLKVKNLLKKYLSTKKACVTASCYDDIDIKLEKCSDPYCPVCTKYTEEQLNDFLRAKMNKDNGFPIIKYCK